MLVGVQQAVEVEASGPLVLRLQDSLGIVQTDPPEVLDERAVGPRQVLRGHTQTPLGLVDLLDQRLVTNYRLLSSSMARTTILRENELYNDLLYGNAASNGEA
jgi:hypothetical protein